METDMKIDRRGASLALLSLTVPAAWAQAGAYPSRPVKLIVPTPPGGGADALARLVGKKLGDLLGQPVVIENRAGAAGNLAAEQVARMAPDGYTIFVGAIAMAVSPALYKQINYDFNKDFTPLTQGVLMSNVLVAHPSLPANNVRELMALAKAQPGTIAYASSGTATSGHLAGELFALAAGVKMLHVPYKGGGPAMNDVLAGVVPISFASPPSAMAFIKSGRLKALGVTTTYRQSALPQVPTIDESGLPGFSANNWYCFLAPLGLPKDIAAMLSRDLRKVLSEPDTAAALAVHGMDPAPGTPEELAAFMKSETEKWGALVRATRMTAN
jgi:tripartite-type tricarboxylate transporter receptor subunit TctC